MKKQSGTPYFNPILKGLSDRDKNTHDAFGRHVHWGYWQNPAQANGSPIKFGEAAEALSRIICDRAGIQSGMRVIDVGCGFGGTIAGLNVRFSELKMVGVNIDPLQLNRAIELIVPLNQNSIQFVEADANCMPFLNKRFDSVLAVESVFHFDRHQFFGEAKRLLVESGKLTISDFLISERAFQYLNGFDLFGQQEIRRAYGDVDLSYSLARYRELASASGLVLCEAVDITKNTMPTYDFLLSTSNGMPNSWYDPSFVKATRMLQKACRQGSMSYQILTFEHAERTR